MCCVTLFPDDARVEPILAGCLRLAREGLAGVDLIPAPYDT
jgi:adenosine deaminase